MIDSIDLKILNILQNNSRTSNVDIARDLEMVPSAILERIRKLEERGLITGYSASINPHEIGLGLLVFLFIRTDEKVGEIEVAKLLAKIPEVLEVHHVAGEDCYLIKLRVKDTGHLSKVMRERFGQIHSIRSTRTTIVLETIKETSRLPLFPQVDTAEKTKRPRKPRGG